MAILSYNLVPGFPGSLLFLCYLYIRLAQEQQRPWKPWHQIIAQDCHFYKSWSDFLVALTALEYELVQTNELKIVLKCFKKANSVHQSLLCISYSVDRALTHFTHILGKRLHLTKKVWNLNIDLRHQYLQLLFQIFFSRIPTYSLLKLPFFQDVFFPFWQNFQFKFKCCEKSSNSEVCCTSMLLRTLHGIPCEEERIADGQGGEIHDSPRRRPQLGHCLGCGANPEEKIRFVHDEQGPTYQDQEAEAEDDGSERKELDVGVPGNAVQGSLGGDGPDPVGQIDAQAEGGGGGSPSHHCPTTSQCMYVNAQVYCTTKLGTAFFVACPNFVPRRECFYLCL